MNKAIILFDGQCNLCNGFVQFVIKRDDKAVFKFAALQAAKAKELMILHKITDTLNTVLLIENERVYTQSTAALRIAVRLGLFWKLCYVFYIVPPFIRNAVYNLIAKYRHKIFGKTSECMIPDVGIIDRFLS